MAKVRIEWVPIRAYFLGYFGFDHLQLVYQPDELNIRSRQDYWFVIEGVRDTSGGQPVLGVDGANGYTTLASANGAVGEDLVARIGTPEDRGSRSISFDSAYNAWQTIASYAAEIDAQQLPYISYSFPGSVRPTINSSSVIASLLYYAGADISSNIPLGLRLSPGTTTLIGTTGNDELKLEQSFTTLLGGKGNDTLLGSDAVGQIDKLYGGEGDDILGWSKGFNIIHGGQPSLDYDRDGTDTIDYTGVGEVTISANTYDVPHVNPDFWAVHDEALDWLFSIEQIRFDGASDHVILGEGVRLGERNLYLDLRGEAGGDQGDTVDLAKLEGGLLINAAADDYTLVQARDGSGTNDGLWLQSAEWIVASDSDDLIWISPTVHGIEGGAGSDLIDARLVEAFSGASPNGYDAEIDGGAGNDRIVSGTGRTLARGGEGADQFVLAARTSGSNTVEFVIEDASADDRLFVPYNFLNGSDGEVEGSQLLPVLGGLDSYDYLLAGTPLYLITQLQDDIFYNPDFTQGVFPLIGAVEFLLDGGDLIVTVYQGVAEPFTEVIDEERGLTREVIYNGILTDTPTRIRIKDFDLGDLGIQFYELGEASPVEFPDGGSAVRYENWDAAVLTLTNNGTLFAPLDERPAVPTPDPLGQEPAGSPEIVVGSAENDNITLLSQGEADAGTGDDVVTGSAGDDILDGGAGDDVLTGNGGDDTYLIASAGDIVIERQGGGRDLVVASADYELPAFVENLDLAGAAVNGTGNDLANRIVGNDVSNTLEGRDGDDTLYGGGGDDVLIGGSGNDGYVYVAGDGSDLIVDDGGADDLDTLVLVDVAPSDITVFRPADTPNDLVLLLKQGGRIVIRDFSGPDLGGIDRVVFDTGPAWSRSDLEALATSASQLENTPPQAADDLFLIGRGSNITFSAAALLVNDLDADGDELAVTAVTGATTGSVSLSLSGDVLVETEPGLQGPVAFTYTVSDGHGNIATAQAEIFVFANTAPTVAAGLADQTSTGDAPWSFAIPDEAFADSDGDLLTLAARLVDGSQLPDWLSFDPDTATFSGTPPPDFSGLVDIEVVASDGIEAATTSFRLVITPGNDAPVAGSTFVGTAGDDVFTGGNGDDVFGISGIKQGFDVFFGGGGSDLISGSAGDDVIGLANVAGNLSGIEVIVGGDGFDAIRLTDGDDILDLSSISLTGIELIDTGAGDDVLTGSLGDDVIGGGAGNDTFVFHPGFGHDAIVDFELGTSTLPEADVIDLSGAGYASFSDLLAEAVQDGADTVITVDQASTLRLINTNLAQLQQDDFRLI